MAFPASTSAITLKMRLPCFPSPSQQNLAAHRSRNAAVSAADSLGAAACTSDVQSDISNQPKPSSSLSAIYWRGMFLRVGPSHSMVTIGSPSSPSSMSIILPCQPPKQTLSSSGHATPAFTFTESPVLRTSSATAILPREWDMLWLSRQTVRHPLHSQHRPPIPPLTKDRILQVPC